MAMIRHLLMIIALAIMASAYPVQCYEIKTSGDLNTAQSQSQQEPSDNAEKSQMDFEEQYSIMSSIERLTIDLFVIASSTLVRMLAFMSLLVAIISATVRSDFWHYITHAAMAYFILAAPPFIYSRVFPELPAPPGIEVNTIMHGAFIVIFFVGWFFVCTFSPSGIESDTPNEVQQSGTKASNANIPVEQTRPEPGKRRLFID